MIRYTYVMIQTATYVNGIINATSYVIPKFGKVYVDAEYVKLVNIGLTKLESNIISATGISSIYC